MQRSYRFALWLFAVSLTLCATRAWADGLIYRLPADGAWVRYKLSDQGKMTMTFPAGVKVPPAYKEIQNLPINSTGTLELRSVGEQEAEGEQCRWIELQMSVEMLAKFPDPQTGKLREQKQQRNIILKMLIPAKNLGAGSDPLADVRKLYFKDGDKPAELVEDKQAKQYELDRFRPIFPAPAANIEKMQKQRVDSPNMKIGQLECEKQTFTSKYEGPLARGRRGLCSFSGKHEICLNKKIPFGVASLKFDGASDEWSGDKTQSPKVTVASKRELVIEDIGDDAKSELPKSN